MGFSSIWPSFRNLVAKSNKWLLPDAPMLALRCAAKPSRYAIKEDKLRDH